MQNELNALYTARENAIREWDATEYNRIDGEIRKLAAYMRAEQRIGLRDDSMIVCTII